MRAGLGMVIAMAMLLGGGAATVHAEYRAYELEVTDILDCRINKLEKCKRHKVPTAMSPDLYMRTHGGQERIGVILLATWMCRGDTSRFRPVCPRPTARKPKYAVGDQVRVRLEEHITEGWEGTVEVTYYQRSVNGNVYGVRFGNRQEVYARYFEKDLRKSTAAAPGKSPAQ